MSEQEKYAIQGKAHADLKEARSNVATIKATLQVYIRNLDEASRSLTRFVAYSSENSHLTNSLKEEIQCISDKDRISGLIDQLAIENKRVAELQEQVDHF